MRKYKILFSLIPLFIFSVNLSGQCTYSSCSGEGVNVFGNHAIFEGNDVPYETTFYTGSEGCDERPWVLVFEDNFDGTTLNTQFWRAVNGVPRGQPTPTDCEGITHRMYTKAENCVVQDGFLNLIAKNEFLDDQTFSWYNAATGLDELVSCDFYLTTGEINSNFNFWRGAYEIRCQIPNFDEALPAFWIFGGNPNVQILDDYDNHLIYQEMIGANEVDFFEINGDCPEKARMTTHLWYNGEFCHDTISGFSETCYPPGNGAHFVTNDDYCGDADYSDDMHVFTCIWDKFILEFYIDGVLHAVQPRFRTILGQELDCSSVNTYAEYLLDWTFPFLPATVIASLGILNGDPNLSNVEASTFKIDYIRFFGRLDCEDKVINNSDFLDTSYPNLFQYVTGNTIVLANGGGIPDNTHVVFIANEAVNMESGFEIGSGATYDINIVENSCSGSGMVVSNGSENVHHIKEENDLFFNDHVSSNFRQFNSQEKISQPINQQNVTCYLNIRSSDGKLILHQNYREGNITETKNLLSSGLYIFEYLDSNLQIIDRQKIVVVN